MSTFRPPGPGAWRTLGDHFDGALTPETQRLFAAGQQRGSASYMAAYGVLAAGLDVAFVHGHLYLSPRPVTGPRELKRTPPTAAVWLLSRVHPAFRRRTRAARRTLADRPWRAVTDRWSATERAGWVQRADALQDEDPAALDDRRLADHLGRVRTLAADGLERHFELHGDDLLPIGLLIARCAEWGVPAATAMSALDGASPASAGSITPPDWQLVTGYDLDALAWCELGAPRPVGETPAPGITAAPATDLRPLVPAEARDELTALVDDARRAVALRDDNGVVIAAWPMGLLRRAMLEAGRRLDLATPAEAVELTVDELTALLAAATDQRDPAAGVPPSAPDVTTGRSDGLGGSVGLDRATAPEVAADRARRRREDSALDAPATLGPVFELPPLDALPRPLALIGAAQLAVADHMSELTSDVVGIGERPYTGRALVVDDPNEAIDLIEPGDVLITTVTAPAWNVVIVHAGALVTTAGGLLSHAAVIARELGIPAIIGVGDATRDITTGATVTVDPITATVTVQTTDAAA